MIEGHDIVCFANDWDSDPLSKKHVMTRLARRNRVLWVDSLGVRNPTVSAHDARRAWRKLRACARGCRQVADNIWVLAPLVVPFHGSPLARAVNRRLLRLLLLRACRRLGFERPVTWSFVPSSGDVVGRLGERLVVYHCVDEYSQFSGTDRGAILEMERRLVERSDLVIVSSSRLLGDKGRWHPRTRLVTHGVEVEHFRRACSAETAPAAPLRRLRRPIIGFFGLIADWVDLDLIRFVAEQRPNWSIVMVGKVDTDASRLEGLPNVLFTGQQPYEDLPAWCRGFDVAIVPFVVNELTLAANPLKMREYLAAGLPVVSTDLPEARRLDGLVRVAGDPPQFLRCIDACLDAGVVGPRLSTSKTMDAESWDAKVEQMCDLVAEALGEAPPVDARRQRCA